MKRKLRTKILVKDYKLCQDLSEEIEQNYTINVIEPANTCLVMAKVLESVGKTEFYMCEILTTEARVEIDGNLGIGIIMGDSKDQAIQLAIIDSAIKAKLKETAAWEKRLLSANEELLHTEQAAFSIVEKSRVKFDIMEEYFDGIGKKS